MQFNVSQQMQSPIGSIREYDVNGIIDLGKDKVTVAGNIKLIRTDRGILATGKLNTKVNITCSRCLVTFSCPLVLNIEEEYFPTIDTYTGASLPSPEEDEEFDSFMIDEHHILDLTDAIRQYELLAIPMKPLCRENCAGLCYNCGHNLNEGLCNCIPPDSKHNSGLNKLASTDTIANKQKGIK
ncbi:MAG: DUF177 domain-containing protein [Dehalococcoidales bacterium]|nr:DUF177 domain-containing protein [Dehalococcoidales bacterium]